MNVIIINHVVIILTFKNLPHMLFETIPQDEQLFLFYR